MEDQKKKRADFLTSGVVHTVKGVGMEVQAASKFASGISELALFGVVSLSAIEVASFALGGTAAAGAITTSAIGGALSAVGLTSMAAIATPVLVGGAVVGALLLGALANKVDSSISPYTGEKPSKSGLLPNPYQGVVKTVKSVGLVGKGTLHLIGGKAHTAGLIAAGIGIAEVLGTAAGLTSIGGLSIPTLGLIGISGVAAPAALAILGGVVAAGFLVKFGAKKAIHQLDNIFAKSDKATPSPAAG